MDNQQIQLLSIKSFYYMLKLWFPSQESIQAVGVSFRGA